MEGIAIKKFLQFDKKYFKIALYVFAVIALSILLEKTLSSPKQIIDTAFAIIQYIKNLTAPFIIGFFIAYLFNPIVEKINLFLIKHIKSKTNERSIRNMSIILTYIIVFGFVAWITAFFIPALRDSIKSFISIMPSDFSSLEQTATTIFGNIAPINAQDLNNFLKTILEPIRKILENMPLLLQKLVSGTFVAASSVLNLVMGLFIAFYMLSDKKQFLGSIRKIIFAFTSREKAQRFIYNMSRINKIFKGFIIGKSIDSIIIGILCFIGFSIIKTPNSLLLSVTIGITNMIPYFGPFIGGIPATLMVLIIDPAKAIWVALFILALQQFDGIVLGPRILGNSTGMSPIWIIFSILVGGALAGPLGMFLGVPICAAIRMFFDEYVNKKIYDKYNDTYDLDENKENTD